MKLKVFHAGELVGTLADDPSRRDQILFQYASSWVDRRIELSPFHLPIVNGMIVRSNPNPIFHNLFGLFYDSLPDAWGMSTLERYFKQIGVLPQEISPLAKLAYMGSRAMGSLSYQPAMDLKENPAVLDAVDLARLDHEAHKILIDSPDRIFPQLAFSSSAGGARPKVVVAIRDCDETVVYGASKIPEGFSGWLVKLAALEKGVKDGGQYGRLEYAYSLMARDAKIEMPETKLLEVPMSGQRAGLFAIRRFDRVAGVGEQQKRHVQTFAALQHVNFGLPCDAGDLFKTTLALTRDLRELEQAFRRVVFNIAACNFDDHAKNFAFLMEKDGTWKLSPAYDVTYSMGWADYRARHMMLVNQSGRPSVEDLIVEAEAFSISSPKEIIGEILEAISDWMKYAKKAKVDKSRAEEIRRKIQEHGIRSS
ncbi:MAG: type II toxin-antitoxin system HipA family toxin [Verrucomicrobiae bacterium]|nr:type II toxin-antitoxin system HipA family toxin [Verrucomicrobiae bacterium]